MKYNFINLLIVSVFWSVPLVGFANVSNVTVTLTPPNWLFAADTIIIPNHEARLAPQEQSLAEQLKPLLAEANYKAAVKVLESYQNLKKSSALLQVSGQVYLALQQWSQAEQVLLKAIAQEPGLSRSHRSLAVIYLQQKQYDKAQQHISQAIALGHQDAQLFGQLAYINMQNHQPWAAISGYQNALLLEPNSKQWQQGLLAALVQSEQYQQANGLVADLLAKDAQNIDLWLRRGQIALNLQQYQKALASFEMAIRLGDNNINNQLLTAQLHIQHGSVEQATLLLSKVLTKDALQFRELHSTFAWLIQNQRYQLTEKLLATITKPSQLTAFDQSQYFTFKGQLAAEKKALKQAVKWYEKALALDANNGLVLLALAEHFAEKQAYSRAELYYIRASVISAVKEQALLGHAQLEINQQDYASAIVLLNKVLAHNPSRFDIKQNITVLQRLQSQAS